MNILRNIVADSGRSITVHTNLGRALTVTFPSPGNVRQVVVDLEPVTQSMELKFRMGLYGNPDVRFIGGYTDFERSKIGKIDITKLQLWMYYSPDEWEFVSEEEGPKLSRFVLRMLEDSPDTIDLDKLRGLFYEGNSKGRVADLYGGDPRKVVVYRSSAFRGRAYNNNLNVVRLDKLFAIFGHGMGYVLSEPAYEYIESRLGAK